MRIHINTEDTCSLFWLNSEIIHRNITKRSQLSLGKYLYLLWLVYNKKFIFHYQFTQKNKLWWANRFASIITFGLENSDACFDDKIWHHSSFLSLFCCCFVNTERRLYWLNSVNQSIEYSDSENSNKFEISFVGGRHGFMIIVSFSIHGSTLYILATTGNTHYSLFIISANLNTLRISKEKTHSLRIETTSGSKAVRVLPFFYISELN